MSKKKLSSESQENKFTLASVFNSIKYLFILILLILIGFVSSDIINKEKSQQNQSSSVTTTAPIGIVSPSLQPTSQIDSPSNKITKKEADPIVNCGPGSTSKQYVKDRSSNCPNYVDCGLNNNSVYTMMLKTECAKKHAEENSAKQPSRTASNLVTCVGSGGKVYKLPPEYCDRVVQLRLLVEQSKISTQQSIDNLKRIVEDGQAANQRMLDEVKSYPTPTPLPNNLFGDWKPTPFEPPKQKCYTTWEEYCIAHPTACNAPIYGDVTLGSPPCD